MLGDQSIINVRAERAVSVCADLDFTFVFEWLEIA